MDQRSAYYLLSFRTLLPPASSAFPAFTCISSSRVHVQTLIFPFIDHRGRDLFAASTACSCRLDGWVRTPPPPRRSMQGADQTGLRTGRIVVRVAKATSVSAATTATAGRHSGKHLVRLFHIVILFLAQVAISLPLVTAVALSAHCQRLGQPWCCPTNESATRT